MQHVRACVATIEQGLQEPLRFSECVAEQHRALPILQTALVPGDHVVDDEVGVGPAVQRQAEGALSDEGVAADGLKRRAGGIGRAFVVATDHPDFAGDLDADLGAAEDVPGRVQRNECVADPARLVKRHALKRSATQTALQDLLIADRGEGVFGEGARMVGVAVGDDRPRHRPPRVDVEVASGAVQATVGQRENVRTRHPLIDAAAAETVRVVAQMKTARRGAAGRCCGPVRDALASTTRRGSKTTSRSTAARAHPGGTSWC